MGTYQLPKYTPKQQIITHARSLTCQKCLQMKKLTFQSVVCGASDLNPIDIIKGHCPQSLWKPDNVILKSYLDGAETALNTKDNPGHKPFLSIVTRHMPENRKLWISRLIASMNEFTDQDYEHIIIQDNECRGIEWANQLFARHRDRINGRYVLMVDDDDYFTSSTVIEEIKAVTDHNANVDVIFVRNKICEQTFPLVWKDTKAIEPCTINTSNFVVRRDVWYRHIPAFGAERMGDYHFIHDIVTSEVYNYHWLDKHLVHVPTPNHGQCE